VAIHSKTKEVELTSRKLIKAAIWQVKKNLMLLLTFCLQTTGGGKTGVAHGDFMYLLSQWCPMPAWTKIIVKEGKSTIMEVVPPSQNLILSCMEDISCNVKVSNRKDCPKYDAVKELNVSFAQLLDCSVML
jgi:hypothetical protein